jgi:hypothetical protein
MVDHHSAVYIFENAKAARVKVGVTCNDVRLRLKDVDRLWSGRKPTCQICGGRRLADGNELFPKHIVSGRNCLGGRKLPLEKDVSIAEYHLESLVQTLPDLSGADKGSVAREIKSLERRIEQFRDYTQPEGIWRFGMAYYTEAAGHIESLSHEILSAHLDTQAPLGEVFCCSLPEAAAAVESALSQMDLLDAVRKETRDDTTSAEFGECIICGGHLTKRSSCPMCSRRFRQI